MSEADDNSRVARRWQRRKNYALLTLAAGILLYKSEEVPASIFSSSPACPEVDSVSVNHRDYSEDGAIAEADLSIIGLAPEQFQCAVTDRRMALDAEAPDLPRVRAM